MLSRKKNITFICLVLVSKSTGEAEPLRSLPLGRKIINQVLIRFFIYYIQ
ncbi:hypothetical protein [Niabella hibiscisoli]|nr:hypothetical protein [Niabella hibiscisoli]MCH5720112.1 hypothetical protein [Niabella hibiscisoli]